MANIVEVLGPLNVSVYGMCGFCYSSGGKGPQKDVAVILLNNTNRPDKPKSRCLSDKKMCFHRIRLEHNRIAQTTMMSFYK